MMRIRFLAFLVALIVGCCWLVSLACKSGKKTKKPLKSSVLTQIDERALVNTNRAWFDVLHYDIDIQPLIAKKILQGSVGMTYEVRQSATLMQIDAYGKWSIDSIFWMPQGMALRKRLNFSEMPNKILIQFPEVSKPGQRARIQIYYHGRPKSATFPPWKDGFVWGKDPLGNPFLGVCAQSTGAALWFPCKDVLSDKPNQGVRMRITVPKDLSAVSNGNLPT